MRCRIVTWGGGGGEQEGPGVSTCRNISHSLYGCRPTFYLYSDNTIIQALNYSPL